MDIPSLDVYEMRGAMFRCHTDKKKIELNTQDCVKFRNQAAGFYTIANNPARPLKTVFIDRL